MTNRIPFSEPSPAGSPRAHHAKRYRDLASEVARKRPQALTKSNGEELEYARAKGARRSYASNFTKGLLHDGDGFLIHSSDYESFVEAINSPDLTLFEKHVDTAEDHGVTFKCTIEDGPEVCWRGWESPRAGHVYELQGPDAGSMGMAPAPRVHSSEFVAEIAEVYSLAILRDVPFTEIASGGGATITGGSAELTGAEVASLLDSLPFYSGTGNLVSSTPARGRDGLNSYERNRRDARLLSGAVGSNPERLFRGSTDGSHAGPYISQFMLAGTDSIGGTVNGIPSYPAKSAKFDAEDGFITYGTQTIDQRVVVHKAGIDHMTEWNHWLDVQNGANLKGGDSWEEERRFITTPRDLATYVHFDALYQAYLNAALILLGSGTPFSRGFPEPSPSGRRDSFATFGGPHILSLVTEVATRCLKAVRRQKFNYHRRARPEATAARLSFAYGERNNKLKNACDLEDLFGIAAKGFVWAEDQLPEDLLKAITDHNEKQNKNPIEAQRRVQCNPDGRPDCFKNAAGWKSSNLLLPMAFPEGSPMHPAYGAGHATVAGGCVTMIKAFFDMYDDCRAEEERTLDLAGAGKAFVPTADGSKLTRIDETVTIQGELDKLAANISIGRNMAGVHYYSDYYDSMRMGERVAVGILMEQIPTYNEEVESTFKSFDGDLLTITGSGSSSPSLVIIDREGCAVSPRDWWLRHVPGEELIDDLQN